jgi:hypothetical protein
MRLDEVKPEYHGAADEMPTAHAIGYLKSALVHLDETVDAIRYLKSKLAVVIKAMERGVTTDETTEGIIGAYALTKLMAVVGSRAMGEASALATGRTSAMRRSNIRLVDLATSALRYNLRESTMGNLETLIEGLRGGRVAGQELTDAHRKDIERVSAAIKAELKRNGIKRVRVMARRDSRYINIGFKSIPDAPTNRVEMANMVVKPLLVLLKRMGGDIGDPLPAATRYIVMKSGIRVIAGANSGENSVLISVTGP